MQKIIESLNISDIEKVNENPKDKKSGITDFGNFDEGYCLKILTKNQNRIIFVICFDKIEEKNQVFDLIRKLKIEEQHSEGIFEVKEKKKETLSDLLAKTDTENQTKNNQQKLEPSDGYWITLQDWSQCNLKCGGGTSTLHRMCVPPKNGGKLCEGESIIHRACNTQACPDTNSNSDMNGKNTEILKPIVKIMAFTDAPQRYTKCKIKETDMMIYYKLDDPNLQKTSLLNGKKIEGMGEISIPTRVIMNNSTLTIFTGQNYETMYQTYNLKNTHFSVSNIKKNCFHLSESAHKGVDLCPFGCESSSKELDEWTYDFDLFKNKCGRNLSNDDKDLNNEIQAKMVII